MSLLDDIQKYLKNVQTENSKPMQPGESSHEQNIQAVRDHAYGPSAKGDTQHQQPSPSKAGSDPVRDALIDPNINKTSEMKIDDQTRKLIEQYNKKNQETMNGRGNLENPDIQKQVQQSIDAYTKRLGEQGLEIPPIQYDKWDGKPLPPPKPKK